MQIIMGFFMTNCDDDRLQINLLFLLNILRVLVTKLRQNESAETEQARYTG